MGLEGSKQSKLTLHHTPVPCDESQLNEQPPIPKLIISKDKAGSYTTRTKQKPKKITADHLEKGYKHIMVS